MRVNIRLNGEAFHLGKSDLPCLIVYKEKSGGSQLSISLAVDVFLRGEKLLFITAFLPGKENFYEQINGEEAKTRYVTDAAQLSTEARAIVLESGNEELLLYALEHLSDINERVVFIKNIETFSPKAVAACSSLKNIILSGDLDACPDKDAIMNIGYRSMIAFSQPTSGLPFAVPPLEKYSGFFWSKNRSGTISI